MKRWTRKLLAGLLSFGMLLQVASPLSALAAGGSTQGGTLSILCAGELLATMNRAADGTLSWENAYNPFEGVQIEYDATSKTYKFEGMLNPPKNGYMTMKTDSTEDSIYIDGGDQKAVNGTVYIGTEESPIKNVTITSSNSEATVKEQAVIRATGDVELFNTSGGQVAEQAASDCRAQSVRIIGGSSSVPTAGVFIWVEDASGNVSIVNNEEDGLVAGGRVRIKADGNVDIKGGIAKTSRESTKSDIISGGKVTFDANASSANALKDMSLTVTAADAVTLKSHSSNSFLSGEKAYIDVTASSLTVGNDGSGVIDGNVKFTRTDTARNDRILTGENADTITSQTAMTGATFDQTVEETYLCIEPGEPEDTSKPDVLSYGFKVNGETANENTLPVGLVYANGKLTASTNYTGDLAIEVTDPALKLDVSLQSVTGDVTLLGVNDVAITGTVNGMLTVGAEDAYARGNVTVNGRLLGGTEINCIGDVKATGSSDGGILKTKDFYQPDIIRCNGTVYLENAGNGYTTCSLTVIGATDVTVKANGVFHAAISGEGDITCSGTVTLTTTGVRAMGSNDPLTYTPMQGDSYTVQLDDQTPFTRTGIFKESEVNLLSKVKSIIITPTGSTPAPGPDDGDTTPDDTGTVDSGSDAGGAVAAVLVGSAAVWGGYEIATRVILHNILPEGAAIPANRGQLALLVWNNAGRPEPAAQPAFADVADADMAKAAQWCVEQGIMEAKIVETFKPEGWMPKFKVIEVWNKAFPKQ